jgi:hypothetical protein
MGRAEAGITLSALEFLHPSVRKLFISSWRAFFIMVRNMWCAIRLKVHRDYAEDLDKALWLATRGSAGYGHEEKPMSIGPISAASLGQDVLLSSNSPQQQALQLCKAPLPRATSMARNRRFRRCNRSTRIRNSPREAIR